MIARYLVAFCQDGPLHLIEVRDGIIAAFDGHGTAEYAMPLNTDDFYYIEELNN